MPPIEVRTLGSRSKAASFYDYLVSEPFGIDCAVNMMMKLYAADRPETHFCALAPGLVDSSMQDYLCKLPNNDDFPVLKKLQGAKNTKYMPSPDEAARLVADCIDKLSAVVKSGAYTDVREFTK